MRGNWSSEKWSNSPAGMQAASIFMKLFREEWPFHPRFRAHGSKGRDPHQRRGGIKREFVQGRLVVISDHINCRASIL